MVCRFLSGLRGRASPGSEELLEALFQEFGARPEILRPWRRDPDPFESLQAVEQHGPVFLTENVDADPDHPIAGDPQDVPVEGGVMQTA